MKIIMQFGFYIMHRIKKNDSINKNAKKIKMQIKILSSYSKRYMVSHKCDKLNIYNINSVIKMKKL